MKDNSEFLRLFQLYIRTAGHRSKRKAAQAIGLDARSINDYETGRSSPDVYACVRLALAVGHDPLTLIAAQETRKETSGPRAEFWRDFFLRVTRRGLLPALIFGGICLTGQPDYRVEAKTLTKHDIIRRKLLRLRACLGIAYLTHETKLQCY